MKLSKKKVQKIVNKAVKAEKKCINYYVEHKANVKGDETYTKLLATADTYRFVINTLGIRDAYLERYGNTDVNGKVREGKP